MEHGTSTRENLVNGNTVAGSEENLGRGVIMSGIEDEERLDEAAGDEPAATGNTSALGSATEGHSREGTEGVEEEGIHL